MFITETVQMRKLGRSREIVIYLPDDYKNSGKRYPVLYINDGQNAFFDENSYCGVSWGFADYTERMHLDLIMVAVQCNYEPYMRESEYGPWKTSRPITILETGRPEPALGGEGAEYVRFLKNELKPYIDQTYPTIPEDTAIAGSSAGGNISVYSALTYPEVFSKCAALSCAFWYYPDQFIELVKKADLSDVKCLYIDHGTDEGNGNEFLNNLYKYDNEMFHRTIMEKEGSERVHFRIYEGAGHNETEWRKRVPVFMELFYGKMN